MNIIFLADGDLSLCVMATAVCKAIKKKYPDDKLLVLTNHPEVFVCNPGIYRAFNTNDLLYFYRDYVDGQQVLTMLHHPYRDEAFIGGTRYLIAAWCAMCRVPYSGELPEIFLTNREYDFTAKRINSKKPLLIMQTHTERSDAQNPYSWLYDMPVEVAQQIADHFCNNYEILHIRREDQPQIKNTTPVSPDFRTLAVLIALSSKRLFINGYAQHIAAALKRPATVCWAGTVPEQFGYLLHDNIAPEVARLKRPLKKAIFNTFEMETDLSEFPYNNIYEVFDPQKICAHLSDEREEERIVNRQFRNNMVADRLVHLLGRANLSNICTILDIGSWHLNQSIEFADIFNRATVHAFEPVPQSYDLCKKKREALPAAMQERIMIHNLALNDDGGEIPFYPVNAERSSTPNIGASSMFRFIEGLNGTPFDQELYQDEIIVQSTTLDEWCMQNSIDSVDIMWMDVQGAELLVLQGAEKILDKTKIIMTEVGLKPYYEGHTLRSDIDALLRRHGFTELSESFEMNVTDYEANTIYIKS